MSTAKLFSVTWYGGEPLLCKDIIYNLSNKFIELSKKLNVEYDAFIITNASLMSNEDIDNFTKYHINGAQITIDGPKEIHDKRRRNIKNKSTFDHLIDRVNCLLNNDLNVIVRINIDKDNINRVDELLDILKDKIEKYQKLKIDFGQVTVFTEICKSVESDCYNNEQYADIMLPLYDKVTAKDFVNNKMTVYPSPRSNYCCVDYANSFVVDYTGTLYRCWNHVGNVKYSCGNVNNFDTEELTSNYFSWIELDPITHSKCRECTLLPICMGGCPDAMRNSADNQPVCGTIKYNLDKVIEYYYQQLKDEVSM